MFRPRRLPAVTVTTLCAASLFFCGSSLPGQQPEGSARLVSVRKIWDQAPHNAFTDLVRFQDQWLCVFREGQGHVSPDGALRVITSADGENWESAALITSTSSDLRDAKITVTPAGDLMLSGAEAMHDRSVKSHQSVAWFSEDGRKWSEKFEIGDPNFWLWRVTWHNDTAYGIGYACGEQKSIRLYTSKDGKRFDTLVERLLDEGYPNETSIVFEGDTAYCLLRRDGNPGSGLLGQSRPPYTQWTWKDLGIKIGGPHMIRIPDGRYVAAVRLYDGGARTSLAWIDPGEGTLREFLKLPSGGDTSYAGLVWHEGLLWVSYYSSHEGKTSIYLAQVQLPEAVRHIGSRRELFVDEYLISRLSGASLKMHQPLAREVVITCDQPWEGNTSAYFTIFEDDGRFRMYYRGSHFNETTGKPAHPEFTCYAESQDGIHWTKPDLGVVEFQGSRQNNIIRAGEDTHNFTPFRDSNPECPPEEQYKAMAGSAIRWGGKGLRAYKSADGIRWSLMQDQAVITDGDFDSQNLAFWHPHWNRYVVFHRKFQDDVRCIMTATSEDFRNWTQPQYLQYGDVPREHLYTNAVQAYPRAAHLLIGFPTRFQPKTQQVEPVLMTSRDGRSFHRWPDPLIPITAPEDRDGNRSNYMTHGLLQLPGQDRELSVYATEAYYAGPGSRVRRFTFRTDGFVSVHAGTETAEMVTRPLRFDGDRLTVNYRCHAKGSLRAEIQDADGRPIAGFTLDDCASMSGDEIACTVNWSGNGDLASLADRPIRLRFVMKNTDLYSLQFK